MISDPARRGQALGDLFLRLGPKLFEEIAEAGALPPHSGEAALDRARSEWDCFALYACVRGLVAAGGFNRETAAAIDALHARVLEPGAGATRALASERYAEYGAIGQEGGHAGAASVERRLGEAAARHMVQGDPPEPLAELVGALHAALAEGAAEAVRGGE
jgi:hypothetical protein